jgi:integrase
VDRATKANVTEFVDAYSADRASSSVAAVVRTIADMVRVTSPEAEVQWIYGMVLHIKRGAEPVKPLAQRKRPATELLQLGETLMERGHALLPDDPAAGAVRYRDGLMIATEINLPLRRKNFAALQLGKSLSRLDARYRITIPGTHMKNGRDFEGWYPESLTAALDFYVERVRPILRAGRKDGDEGWLWLGRHGDPMKGASISARVRDLIRAHTGVPLSLHSFRHSAATDIALHDPKHAGIIKSVLGQASPLSAKHYDLASAFDAAIRYQAMLSDQLKEDKQR